jgi:hypothetical protein
MRLGDEQLPAGLAQLQVLVHNAQTLNLLVLSLELRLEAVDVVIELAQLLVQHRVHVLESRGQQLAGGRLARPALQTETHLAGH